MTSYFATSWLPKGIQVLDGDSLVGVVVDVAYSDSVETVADLSGTEVGAGRLAATAVATREEAGWTLNLDDLTTTSTAVDRLGVWWATAGATDADRLLIAYSDDPGGAESPYEPTWDDGLIFLPFESRGGVVAVVAGTNVTVDATDPLRPVVSATGGGGGASTSDDLDVISDGVNVGPLTPILASLFDDVNAAEEAIAADAWLQPVRVVATSTVDTSTGGLLTIDGVTLAAGNRVLLTANGTDNRIYVAAVGSWPQAAVAYASGAAVRVTEGTLHAESEWYISTPDPIMVGSTSITWTEFTGGGAALSDDDPADLGTADPGTSPDASRSDHIHDLPTAAAVGALATGALDTDATMAANSDTKIASQKATKTALALKAPLASPTFTGTVSGIDATMVGAVPTTRTLAGLDLSTDRTASALRTALTLVIGTDVEAHDTDLTTIGGLSPSNDDLLQRKSGAWANRTLAQVKSDLALNNVDNTSDITRALLVANNQTGTTYTLVLGDAGKVIEANNASAIALTVPTNASVAFPTGTVIEVYQMGAGQVTVSGAGVTFRAPHGLKTSVQYAVISLWKRDTDTWVVSGDATT